jgi:hypothetical protein
MREWENERERMRWLREDEKEVVMKGVREGTV